MAYSCALILLGPARHTTPLVGALASAADLVHLSCPDRVPDLTTPELLPPPGPVLVITSVFAREQLHRLEAHFAEHRVPAVAVLAKPAGTPLSGPHPRVWACPEKAAGSSKRQSPRHAALLLRAACGLARVSPGVAVRLVLGEVRLHFTAGHRTDPDYEALFKRAHRTALQLAERYNAQLEKHCANCSAEIVPGLRCARCGEKTGESWQVVLGDEFGYRLAPLADRRENSVFVQLSLAPFTVGIS